MLNKYLRNECGEDRREMVCVWEQKKQYSKIYHNQPTMMFVCIAYKESINRDRIFVFEHEVRRTGIPMNVSPPTGLSILISDRCLITDA